MSDRKAKTGTRVEFYFSANNPKAMSECDGNHALSDCDDLECWHDDNRRFNIWWYNEGSGLRPLRNEDASEHVRRVSRISWLKGEYSQITKEQKP